MGLLIMVSAIEYSMLTTELEDVSGENWHNLNSERRTLFITQLASNVRSYINVASGLEYSLFEVNELDRF